MYVYIYRDSQIAQLIKNLLEMQEAPVQFLGWEDLLGRKKLPTPVLWPRKLHGLHSSWGRIVTLFI